MYFRLEIQELWETSNLWWRQLHKCFKWIWMWGDHHLYNIYSHAAVVFKCLWACSFLQLVREH